MNLTYDQLILLSVAAKFFLYKFREDSTPELNQKLMELIEIIQDYAEKMKNETL